MMVEAHCGPQPFGEPVKAFGLAQAEDTFCSLDLAIDDPSAPASFEADALAMVTAMESAMPPGDLAACAWTGATEEGRALATKAARYGDKAKGMSLQDRLSQLEFSDEEDESPRSKVAAISSRSNADEGALRKSLQRGETLPQPEVTACETFVPPSDDDDED